MSAVEDRFKELLSLDTDILTLLEGGIYTVEELGMLGLTHDNPTSLAAFEKENSQWFIRPCVVIRERIDTPTYTRYDANQRLMSFDGVAELWFYEYGDSATISEAAELVYQLLSFNTYSGLGLVRPIQQLKNLFAPEFVNTSLRRDDYQFKRTK